MATHNVGLNTGNTGSLVCVSMRKSAAGSSQVAASSFLGSTSLSIIDRMVFLASFPVSGPGTVTNAKLRLANADGMAATTSLELRALLTTFVQAQATWNNRTTATAWNVAGALSGTDVDSTVIATGTTPTTGSNTVFDITGAGLNAFVQGCIDGTISIPALIINKVNDTTDFAAAQNRIRTDTGTDGFRPVLIFDFVPATPPSITMADITVTKYDSEATLTALLSDVALAGGVDMVANTYNITATAGVHYTALVDEDVTIPQGDPDAPVVIQLLS